MGGLSAIVGILALLGFLVFLAGAGLAVMASSQGRPARGGVMLALVGLVVGLVFWVIGQGLIYVEPTEVAVVINTLTGEVEEPKSGGTHIIVPIVQRVAVTYPVTQLEYTMAGSVEDGARAGDDSVVGRTSDGQTVNVDITIIYRIPGPTSGQVYRSWNENYLNGFVRPTTRSVAREVVSRYSAEQIYGEAREQLGNDIQEALAVRFTEENLVLTDLLVRDINFSQEFTQAIEQKVVAEQNLARARTEAQRVEAEAQGQARAALARAEGDASAIEVRAQAEAEALRLVSQQISSNPSLIQYLYVQNLSDNVSIALVPTNSPFLFDFSSLADPDSDFVAPAVPQQIIPEGTPEAEPGS